MGGDAVSDRAVSDRAMSDRAVSDRANIVLLLMMENTLKPHVNQAQRLSQIKTFCMDMALLNELQNT
jgi:hypothetical protein